MSASISSFSVRCKSHNPAQFKLLPAKYQSVWGISRK